MRNRPRGIRPATIVLFFLTVSGDGLPEPELGASPVGKLGLEIAVFVVPADKLTAQKKESKV